MDFSVFLTPCQWHHRSLGDVSPSALVHDVIFYHQEEDWRDKGVKIALFGVEEDRSASHNMGCAQASHAFRDAFYLLTKWDEDARIMDLGNVQSLAGRRTSLTGIIWLMKIWSKRLIWFLLIANWILLPPTMINLRKVT
jgi:hypothetical protein